MYHDEHHPDDNTDNAEHKGNEHHRESQQSNAGGHIIIRHDKGGDRGKSNDDNHDIADNAGLNGCLANDNASHDSYRLPNRSGETDTRTRASFQG